jgi:hypothetical protein
MSPNFPPMRAPPRTVASPAPERVAPLGPRSTDIERPGAGTRFVLARVVVTVAGVAGFLSLLVAAVQLPSAQQMLRIAAFVWFFAFGAARVALDFRAARASRGGGAWSGRGQHRPGSWLG